MTGPGRPPLPDSERMEVLSIRLDAETRDMLDDIAEAENSNRTQAIRDMIRRSWRRRQTSR